MAPTLVPFLIETMTNDAALSNRQETQEIAICPQVSFEMKCTPWGADIFMGGTTVFLYFRTELVSVSLQGLSSVNKGGNTYILRFQVHRNSKYIPLQSESIICLDVHVLLMTTYF
jgi:hypothetical protein